MLDLSFTFLKYLTLQKLYAIKHFLRENKLHLPLSVIEIVFTFSEWPND